MLRPLYRVANSNFFFFFFFIDGFSACLVCMVSSFRLIVTLLYSFTPCFYKSFRFLQVLLETVLHLSRHWMY